MKNIYYCFIGLLGEMVFDRERLAANAARQQPTRSFVIHHNRLLDENLVPIGAYIV